MRPEGIIMEKEIPVSVLLSGYRTEVLAYLAARGWHATGMNAGGWAGSPYPTNFTG